MPADRADVTANGYTVRSNSWLFKRAAPRASPGFACTSGSGALNNDQLTGSISGTLSCGRQSLTSSLSFTSTAKGAYGTVTAHGGKGLAAAVRLLRK